MNQTENLKLNKYDPITDAKQPFSISDGLNANWDIIDAAHEELKTYTDTNIETINKTISSLPTNITLAMLPDWDVQPRSTGITYTASTFGWVRWFAITGQTEMYLKVNDVIVGYCEAKGANDTSGGTCFILVKPQDKYYANAGTIEFYACNGI